MLRTALLVSLVAACAADPTSQDVAATGGGKADGSEPTLTFAGDFTQKLSGTLRAGSPVIIRYDLGRLTDCRAESNNSDVWGVTGYAQFDDGSRATFAVSNLVGGHAVSITPEVALPASASHVDFWFAITNEWGCIAYDSNFGSNFSYDLDRHGLGATLDFGSDWSFAQTAAVHAGDQIVVHYSPDRLNQCQAETNAMAAWGITLHWQVDGGAVHDVSVERPNGEYLTPADPILTLPHGSDLAMWFEATSVYGCHAWDSDYNANYHVAID